MATVESTPQPPSYDLNPSSDEVNINLDDLIISESSPVVDLPVYPGRQERPNASQQMKEFHYELKNKGKAIAILTIIASSSYSRQLPSFMEGQKATGRVQLILEKPDPIQSVVVSAIGQYITGADPGGELTFMNISQTLWTQADGEPQNVTTSSEGDSSPTTTATTKFTGKLQGNYTWQFALDLPKEVSINVGNRKQIFALPQTFYEMHSLANIAYELSVKLVRNKFRADHSLPAKFGYIQATRPPPLPSLRRLAYQEGTPLLGPTVDPAGWHSANLSVHLQGEIFNTRIIQVQCKLFLAKPLSYTRGSVIPLCIRLEGDDSQALDLLSNPKAIVVRLKRRLRYEYDAEKKSFAGSDVIAYSQPAVWWPSTEGSEDRQGRLRFINGEIHLKADIKPTSAVAKFRIEYSVVLFPFKAVGIELEGTDALLEEHVGIVTIYAPGPRPKRLAPPGYEAELAATQVINPFSMSSIGTF